MANIITLTEKLTFGKYIDCTGHELMQSRIGTRYLVWIWNNTDIPMDAHIAHALVSQGLVSRDVERRNSRQGGAVSTIPFSEGLDPRMLEGAMRHQMRHDAIQGGAHDSEADTARVWLVKGDDRTKNICNNNAPYFQQLDRGERAKPVIVCTSSPGIGKNEILSRFREMLNKESREVDKLVR